MSKSVLSTNDFLYSNEIVANCILSKSFYKTIVSTRDYIIAYAKMKWREARCKSWLNNPDCKSYDFVVPNGIISEAVFYVIDTDKYTEDEFVDCIHRNLDKFPKEIFEDYHGSQNWKLDELRSNIEEYSYCLPCNKYLTQTCRTQHIDDYDPDGMTATAIPLYYFRHHKVGSFIESESDGINHKIDYVGLFLDYWQFVKDNEQIYSKLLDCMGHSGLMQLMIDDLEWANEKTSEQTFLLEDMYMAI
jgi:hypothetical protein